MIDSVLGYHLNPQTCGVAKFNQQLAARLCVPVVDYLSIKNRRRYRAPLVSVKASEMERGHWPWLLDKIDRGVVLLHDRPDTVPTTVPVLYADALGCPSTVQGTADRGMINVLLFGMAHKREATRAHLLRLGDLLAKQRLDWTVSVSQAVHEGSPWDTTWAETAKALHDIFGVRLRVLGYLADDALAKELREATAAALFFEPAARLNNTSLWAALDAKCPLITNLDAQSPSVLVHGRTCFDIAQLTEWPIGMTRTLVAREGQAVSLGWDRVLEAVRCA